MIYEDHLCRRRSRRARLPVAWIVLIVIPAWSSYWRLRERILAVVMSVYILVAFVGMGACAGAVFLYYYDRL